MDTYEIITYSLYTNTKDLSYKNGIYTYGQSKTTHAGSCNLLYSHSTRVKYSGEVKIQKRSVHHSNTLTRT